MPPRISVVVPALNESAVLAECLQSLQAQDFDGAVEVIVVDNGSTDDTAAIAAAHGARVIHEPVRGVCQARQRGTAAATGDIVVSTDADTTFVTSWLRRIDATFATRPDAVAVCGPCRFVDGPWWGSPYATLLFGIVVLYYRLVRRVCYASATNIAFRRDAWCGYDLHLTQGGDELGLLRSLRRRGPIVFDRTNQTLTSSRRLHRGLFYNVIVTCLYYYLIAYNVNRLTHRPVLGTAPAIRPGDGGERYRSRRLVALAGAGALVAAYWFSPLDLA